MKSHHLSKWPRFRVLSGKGVFLGWIQRPTEDEANEVARVVFPREAVRIEFRETDQD